MKQNILAMNLPSPFIISRKTQQFIKPVCIITCGLILLTLLQDFVQSKVTHSGYYLQESLIFSCYWLLFVPLIYAQFRLLKIKTYDRISIMQLPVIISPICVHLLAYPALVWILSTLFYNHSFAYAQTLGFALSEYLYITIAAYTISFVTLITLRVAQPTKDIAAPPPAFASNITISEGSKHICLDVNAILYFTASSPYVNTVTAHRKYLYKATLKTLEQELDPKQFIRIHKSTIINKSEVSSYTSRHNGDYDVTMCNGAVLRLSRNYVAAFRQAIET